MRTFQKRNEMLDNNKKIVDTYTPESFSIRFYYDITNEMIAFSERQSFGYNQFINAFMRLMNKNIKGYSFEIFLQKDKDALQKKINEFSSVQKIKVTLIPPNSLGDDLAELRKTFPYLKQLEEIKATKSQLTYTSENMKMDSKIISELITASARGYGDFTAFGKDREGVEKIVKSNQDAAYVQNISDNIDEKGFNEIADRFIKMFKSKIKTTKKKGAG